MQYVWQISNRLLISQALVIVSPSAHNLSHLPALLHSLSVEIKPLPSRASAYISGLSLFPPPSPTSYMDTPSLLHLDNCLRLLDSCLLGSWSITSEEMPAQTSQLDELREHDFAEAIIALCVTCGIILLDSDLEDHRPVGTSWIPLRVMHRADYFDTQLANAWSRPFAFSSTLPTTIYSGVTQSSTTSSL